MVWTCAEEGKQIYRTKGVEYEAVRQEEKKKTAEKMDIVKEDVKEVGNTVEDARDRVRWRQMILRGDP